MFDHKRKFKSEKTRQEATERILRYRVTPPKGVKPKNFEQFSVKGPEAARLKLTKDNPAYSTIHNWLSRNVEKPLICDDCGVNPGNDKKGATKLHWANISGRYLRDAGDYKCLCVRCHVKMDGIGFKKGDNAKLSFGDVVEIKNVLIKGNVKQRKLADKYGVSEHTISKIKHGKNWNYVKV